MKAILTFLAFVFLCGQTSAQTTEYLQQKEFQAEKKKIYDGLNASRKQLNEIKKVDVGMTKSIDSIEQSLLTVKTRLSEYHDSLVKSNAGVNTLREQFDNQKILSRGFLILLFVVILILFVIVFALIAFFNKKANQRLQSVIDLGIATSNRLDLEVATLNNSIQDNLDRISAISAELSYKIATVRSALEAKNMQLESQFAEDLSVIKKMNSQFKEDLLLSKQEQAMALKNQEGKSQALSHDLESLNQKVMAHLTKIEEDLNLFKHKH
jgi:hypothetical protein